MAVSLTTYMNSKLKAMGKTASQAKKNAGKYKSISAAKKAGSLYYTDKNGKVIGMANKASGQYIEQESKD